jgi:hypothetical protein
MNYSEAGNIKGGFIPLMEIYRRLIIITNSYSYSHIKFRKLSNVNRLIVILVQVNINFISQ